MLKKLFFITMSLVLLGFSVITVDPILSPSISISTDEVRTKKIDSLLQKYFSVGPLGGTALLSKKGSIIYKKAFGKADLQLNTDMGIDYKMRIASNTKQFRACAILRLEEEGKLSLCDRLTDYIEDYPPGGNEITIEHLLTHTSGIPDFSSLEGFSEIESNDYNPLEFINVFKKYPLSSNPGEQFEYSNSGYFLLGYIIEKVSGLSYGNYLKTTFFDPLGMESTFYDFPKKDNEGRAEGYIQQSSHEFAKSRSISMSIPFAAGSLVSTVGDLFVWYEALKDNSVISEESLIKAHSPYLLKNGKYTRYGYGWDLGTLLGSPLIGHGGAISGFYSTLVYLPDEDVLAVVLTNCNWSDPSFFDLATKMASIAVDKVYYEEPDLKKEELKSYEGIYRSALHDEISITIEGGRPFFKAGKGPKRLIKNFREDIFYSEINFTTLKFVRNDLDELSSLVIARTLPVEFFRTTESVPQKSVHLELQSIMSEDISSAIDHYKNLKSNFYKEFDFLNPEDLNQLGYDLLANDRILEAIKIFHLLVSEFPAESNAYDSLGEAYLLNSEYKLAKINYQKSLELNQQNDNAREVLKKIAQLMKS